MSNPLLAKYDELYGPKKEEPRPDYYKGEKSYAEELKELRDNSTIPCVSHQSVATSNTSTGITAANHIPKITSYDPYSGEDSFLQIAEKVKSKDARVTSVTLNRDVAGHFYTGRTTITFEVEAWNT